MSWGRRRRDFRGRIQIIMITIAVFVFSELKFAHEHASVNTYGVLKAAYTNNNAILGMSHQQGEGIIII